MRKLDLAICMLVLATATASACEGKKVILEDGFVDELSGWEADPVIKIGGGAMTIALKADAQGTTESNTELNKVFHVKDADLCVDAIFPTTLEGEPGVGLVFWATDYSNYYLLLAKPSGHAAVHRRLAGKWIMIGENKDVGALKRDAGASNRLRVVAKGNVFSASVNGAKVAESRAQPPEADWKFGLYGQTDKPATAAPARTIVFKNFKATSTD